jgi:hypothetical protein
LNKGEKGLGGLNGNCSPKLEADDLCKEKKMVPLRRPGKKSKLSISDMFEF